MNEKEQLRVEIAFHRENIGRLESLLALFADDPLGPEELAAKTMNALVELSERYGASRELVTFCLADMALGDAMGPAECEAELLEMEQDDRV